MSLVLMVMVVSNYLTKPPTLMNLFIAKILWNCLGCQHFYRQVSRQLRLIELKLSCVRAKIEDARLAQQCTTRLQQPRIVLIDIKDADPLTFGIAKSRRVADDDVIALATADGVYQKGVAVGLH